MPDPVDPGGAPPPSELPGDLPLQVTVDTHEGHARFVATGEIDMLTVADFSTALDSAMALDTPNKAVICDLTGLTFIGSHGMAVLLDAASAADRTGRELRLVSPEDSLVTRTLKIGGLPSVCRIFETLADAVED